jgi:hypothetical protein
VGNAPGKQDLECHNLSVNEVHSQTRPTTTLSYRLDFPWESRVSSTSAPQQPCTSLTLAPGALFKSQSRCLLVPRVDGCRQSSCVPSLYALTPAWAPCRRPNPRASWATFKLCGGLPRAVVETETRLQRSSRQTSIGRLARVKSQSPSSGTVFASSTKHGTHPSSHYPSCNEPNQTSAARRLHVCSLSCHPTRSRNPSQPSLHAFSGPLPPS